MNQRSLLSISLIAGLALALSAGNAAAQSAKDLVGTWTIVSAQAFGPSPKGILIFDANGRFSQVLLRPDLPKYAANNRNEGSAEENKATVQGTLAFFGTYSINGTDMTRHIEGSSFPNWTGTDQKLTNLTVTRDELNWTNGAPSGGGGTVVVVWKRAK